MKDAESRLAALEQRLQAVEDELAIHRLLARYGMSADCADADQVADCFTSDGVYDVSGVLRMEGSDALRAMINGPGHQRLMPDAGHTVGPLVVQLHGDRATAWGYSRTYHRENGAIVLFRLAYNRIDLLREAGRWRIARRVNRMVGEEGAQDIYRQG
ncbi:MAG: nuclear transport factor 2 family protein, partial [Dehalococcoidia bacterium]|nr:nuclear transport factor 2 family protein [Dehalococcoidia bacterium]